MTFNDQQCQTAPVCFCIVFIPETPLTRQDPLSDDAVLVAEHPEAAGELVVELVVGIAEVEEAELPQAHVLEVQVGDLV